MKPLVVMLLILGLGTGLAGCTGGDTADRPPAGKTGRGIHVEFRDAADSERPGYLRMNLSGTARFYHVSEDVLIDTDAIARAEIDTVGRAEPAVVLIMNETGRAALAEITRTRVGKRMGVMVDGLLVSAPLVMAEIDQGRAVIEGHLSLDEAQRIVDRLNAR